MIKNIIQILLILIFLNQCSLLKPLKTQDIKYYQPKFTNLISKCNNSHKDVILISNAEVYSPYNSRFMYYSTTAGNINYYKLNQWSSDTGILLTQLIIQKLEQSCLYSGVVSSNSLVLSNYKMIIQVMTFQQYIDNGKSKMELVVFIQIIDNYTNKIIKSKKFINEVNISPDINGYLQGANMTLANFLNDLYLWLK